MPTLRSINGFLLGGWIVTRERREVSDSEEIPQALLDEFGTSETDELP